MRYDEGLNWMSRISNGDAGKILHIFREKNSKNLVMD